MTTGVLVMAYGTPAGPQDVASFYTDIRRGRPPNPDQLANLEDRYRSIGGVSPLAERTAAQVEAVGRALEDLAPSSYRVFYGSKHADPKIEDAVDAIATAGIDRLVGLVLAPHYSSLSVGQYIDRARKRASLHAIRAGFVEHWHDDEALVEVLSERLVESVSDLEARSEGPLEVVFSAHSLPARILDYDDPYPRQLAETAALVAERAGIVSFRTGWQSAGRTPEPWLGPDILELLDVLAGEGVKAVAVCPAGFTSDHLEILYDLDIEARAKADRLGLAFARTKSLNNEPRVAAGLARRIVAVRALFEK